MVSGDALVVMLLIEPMISGARLVDEIRTDNPYSFSMWRLGQSGVVCRFGNGKVVAIDPYLSNHCEAAIPQPMDHRRMTRSPLDGSELGFVDILVCTHDHLDHLDVPTLRSASRLDSMTVVAPKACETTLRDLGWARDRTVLTKAGSVVNLNGLQLQAFAVPHEQFDEDSTNGHPYQGFVVSDGVLTVAHLGDAMSHPAIVEVLSARKIDVALIPINGRSRTRASMGFAGNMNATEAVQLGKDMSAGIVVPMHYDMFAQNVDKGALVTFKKRANGANLNYRVLEVGEAWHHPNNTPED